MQIARVLGTVVSTQKHRKFEGAKLLLVQPLAVDDAPRGPALLAVDGVGAGVHEKVPKSEYRHPDSQGARHYG